jgi:cytochrome d ubiquinol oxidase subunit II
MTMDLGTIWFILWGVLWAVYFILDGFDLGLGALRPFFAKTEDEKRIIYNAMGPFWDGNEVWLITAGGVTFAAFPIAYATMFSTLYTPLMLLLFALILRGVAFEFRSKVNSAAWRKVWDTCLVLGSFLPALLLGVAFANLFAGIPVDREGSFHGNLLTLLNPYGLVGGLFFVLAFAHHGALWLLAKSEGHLSIRAAKAASGLWIATLLVTLAFLGYTWWATRLWQNLLQRPVFLILPVLAAGSLVASRLLLFKGRFWQAWGASALFILTATLFGVAGMFPNIVASSLDPAASVTAFNGASSTLTLKIMLGVVLAFLPVVIAYQSWVYVRFREPVTSRTVKDGPAY